MARGRWRTWIRRRTPTLLYRRLGLVIPKVQDCGDHEWYHAGAGVANCYHCRATGPWPAWRQYRDSSVGKAAASVETGMISGDFRFEVQSVHVLRGRGTVAVGWIRAGWIRVGAEVAIGPEREGPALVRGVETFSGPGPRSGGPNRGLLVDEEGGRLIREGMEITACAESDGPNQTSGEGQFPHRG